MAENEIEIRHGMKLQRQRSSFEVPKNFYQKVIYHLKFGKGYIRVVTEKLSAGTKRFLLGILRNSWSVFFLISTIAITMTAVSFNEHPLRISPETGEAFRTQMTVISATLKTWETLEATTTTNRLGTSHSNYKTNPNGHQRFPQNVSICSTDVFRVIPTIVLEAHEKLYSVDSMHDLCILEKRIRELNLTGNDEKFKPGEPLLRDDLQVSSLYSLGNCSLQQNQNVSCSFKPQTLNSSVVFNQSTSCYAETSDNLRTAFGCSKTSSISPKKILISRETANDTEAPVYIASYVQRTNQPPTNISLRIYHDIYGNIQLDHLKIVGLSIEEDGLSEVLGQMITEDLTRLVPVAAVMVILIMLIYCRSFLYTFVSAVELFFAFGTSYFIYFYIYGYETYWFTNYLSGIILLGIGADDCFVLFSAMTNAETALKKEEQNNQQRVLPGFELQTIRSDQSPLSRTMSRMQEIIDEDRKLEVKVNALSKAALAMLVTTLTTAVAFATNIITDVVSISSFGAFAATLVVIDYIFAITFLPAALNLIFIHEPSFEMVRKTLYSRTVTLCKWNFGHNIRRIAEYFHKVKFAEKTAKFLHIAKYIFAPGVIILLVTASLLTFVYPKIAVAQQNPKLFHSSHPFQWFRQNYYALFDLPEQTIIETVHVIWGVKPNFDKPDEPMYDESFQYIFDNRTEGSAFLDKQQKYFKSFQKNSTNSTSIFKVVDSPKPCFAEEFNSFKLKNCKDKRKTLGECYLQWERSIIGSSSSVSSDSKRQGPLFEVSNYKVIKGYVEYFELEFSDLLNTSCQRIKDSRVETEEFFKFRAREFGLEEPWVVSSSKIASKMLYKCEMKEVLISTTLPSVGISLGIAFVVVFLVTQNVKAALSSVLVITTIILTTMGILALLQWELNIVEAIIITLGVGLSFDFTLHLAVAYTIELLEQTKEYGEEVVTIELITGMLEDATVPIVLSAISTFSAGLTFCFAQSYPFYQVGLFMVLIMLVSLFGSTFLFTSLVACVEEVSNKIYHQYRYSLMNTQSYQISLAHDFLKKFNLEQLSGIQQMIKSNSMSVYTGELNHKPHGIIIVHSLPLLEISPNLASFFGKNSILIAGKGPLEQIEPFQGLDDKIINHLLHEKMISFHECTPLSPVGNKHLFVLGSVSRIPQGLVESSYRTIEGNSDAEVTFIGQYGLHKLDADQLETNYLQKAGGTIGSLKLLTGCICFGVIVLLIVVLAIIPILAWRD